MGYLNKTINLFPPIVVEHKDKASKSNNQRAHDNTSLIHKLGVKVQDLLHLHEHKTHDTSIHRTSRSLSTSSRTRFKSLMARKRKNSSSSITRSEELDMIRVIGKGAFGKVFLCTKRLQTKSESCLPTPPANGANLPGKQTSPNHARTKKQFEAFKASYFAVKVVDKSLLTSDKAVEQAAIEVNVMKSLTHPFIVRLHDAFQSKTKLYMVLDYASGGELFYQLQTCGRFTETRAQLYAAEVALALGHLHSIGILYRDLKPENLLIDSQGHIKLTDFGLCCKVTKDERAITVCGTPAYASPEILLQHPYGFAADWWALGVLTYEMIVGCPPFHHPDIQMMYRMICDGPIQLPNHISFCARSFICRLLKRDVSSRLGSSIHDVEEIKNHRFFQPLDWDAVLKKETAPEFIPDLSTPTDTKYFDDEFTSLPLYDQPKHGKPKHAIAVAAAATAKATSVFSHIFHVTSQKDLFVEGFRPTDGVQVSVA